MNDSLFCFERSLMPKSIENRNNNSRSFARLFNQEISVLLSTGSFVEQWKISKEA